MEIAWYVCESLYEFMISVSVWISLENDSHSTACSVEVYVPADCILSPLVSNRLVIWYSNLS